MPIEFACEACAKLLRVPDGSGGRACQCPACGTLLDIPEPVPMVEVEMLSPSPPQEPAGQPGKLRIPCPECRFELVCDASLVGTKGQCRHCKHIFVISDRPHSTPSSSAAAKPGLVFSCPKCQQLFEGQPGMQGRKGKCHACGEVFSIALRTADSPAPPPQRTSADEPAASAAEVLPREQSRPPAPASGPRQTPSATAPSPPSPSPSPRSPAPSSAPPAAAPARPLPSPAATAKAATPRSPAAPLPSAAPIQLACARCKGVMEVPGSAAGQTTNCPYCQQLLKIPTPPVGAAARPAPRAPTTQAAGPARAQPKIAPPAPAENVWDELGDLSGAVNAYAPPNPLGDAQTWQAAPQRRALHGLTFSNAFELTFRSFFPSGLIASLLFGFVGVVSFVCILLAQFAGRMLYEALQPQSQLGVYAAVVTPLAIVVIVMHFLSNAAFCMTSNTAWHVVRSRRLSPQAIFSTGSAYGGMLVLMFAWSAWNLLRHFGVPYLAYQLVQNGQRDMAVPVGLSVIVLMTLVQIVAFFMFCFVPFALLEEEDLPNAMGSSVSVVLNNFFLMWALNICGWLLYILVGVLTCGLGFIVFIGAPIYFYAAIYRLATK